MAKIIRLNLKYTRKDPEIIKKSFTYPIESFLNGYGQWTYNDMDKIKFTLTYPANRANDSLYDYHSERKYECKNNGKKCRSTENKNYIPSIEPLKLLNIDTWDKIYFYQEGEQDQKDWIIACKNKDGIYIYFRASSDYTGFDCQGLGDISYSANKQTFWNQCLDNLGRTLILAKNGVKFKINIP